jgi:cardiolipin synthase
MNIATTRNPSKSLSIPNILTVGRIAAIPVVVGCVYVQSILDGPLWLRWVALAVFIAAGITDYLDGYYARIWDQQSAFGRMLDPTRQAAGRFLPADARRRQLDPWLDAVGRSRDPVPRDPVSGLREYPQHFASACPSQNLRSGRLPFNSRDRILIAGEAGEQIILTN